MTLKKTKSSIAVRFLFALFMLILLSMSCADGNANKENRESQKYDGVTIEMEISKADCLDILLDKDGTINRKGSGVVDTSDRNFFLGITKDKILDSLMNGISNDLLTYCNTSQQNCDTTKQTCKVKIAFGDNHSLCEIEQCVNGTFDDLPKPIKDFVEKAIHVTEPWYQSQMKTIPKKQSN